jgi:hypothetical protein
MAESLETWFVSEAAHWSTKLRIIPLAKRLPRRSESWLGGAREHQHAFSKEKEWICL